MSFSVLIIIIIICMAIYFKTPSVSPSHQDLSVFNHPCYSRMVSGMIVNNIDFFLPLSSNHGVENKFFPTFFFCLFVFFLRTSSFRQTCLCSCYFCKVTDSTPITTSAKVSENPNLLKIHVPGITTLSSSKSCDYLMKRCMKSS